MQKVGDGSKPGAREGEGEGERLAQTAQEQTGADQAAAAVLEAATRRESPRRVEGDYHVGLVV